MAGRPWTPEEIDYLTEYPEDWEGFAARFGGRTQGAWRLKREDMRLGPFARARDAQAAVDDATRRMVAQANRNLGMDDEAIPDLPTDAAALERLFAAIEEVAAASQDLPGKPPKQHRWNPGERKPTGVAFFGDLHFGGIGVDYQRLKRDVQLLAETDGLYGVLMGDLVDNFKPQAKSGAGLYFQANANPALQVAHVATRLRVGKPKWVALAGGNHEAFDGKWAGIDRLPALAKDLGACYFNEAGGSIFATIGNRTWHVIVKHDWRGRSALNKGNAARRLWDEWPWAWQNGDVVCLAHLHEPHSETPRRKGEKVVYLRTGSYKQSDPWAESQGYRPSYGVPLAILWPDRRKVCHFDGEDFDEGVDYLRWLRASWDRAS